MKIKYVNFNDIYDTLLAVTTSALEDVASHKQTLKADMMNTLEVILAHAKALKQLHEEEVNAEYQKGFDKGHSTVLENL